MKWYQLEYLYNGEWCGHGSYHRIDWAIEALYRASVYGRWPMRLSLSTAEAAA